MELGATLTLARKAMDLYDAGAVDSMFGTGTVLVWLIALDDAARDAIGDDYRPARDADDRGQVLDGLRLARNAIVHGQTFALSPRGREYPLRYDAAAYGPVVWVPYSRLTASWKPKARGPFERANVERQQRVYTEAVAGREVRPPISDALAWFDRLRADGWAVRDPHPS